MKARILLCICASIVLSCANQDPRLKDMVEFTTPNFRIFHAREKPSTLSEMAVLLEQKHREVSRFLETRIDPTEVYIYKDQRTFQRKKYGFIADILRLDWYIGDNIGQKALILSPNSAAPPHDYSSVLNALPHEFVHTVVYRINPRCDLWINEGLALYLSNRTPDKNLLRGRAIPKLKILRTRNPLYFANNGGYDFADTYIEFLLETYGRKTLLEFVKHNDYRQVLSATEERIYRQWVAYLTEKYRG